MIKRFFDIFISVLALTLLFGVFVVIAIMIYCKLGRPILFQQIRPGKNGKPFVMIKFRTMQNNFDASGKLLPDSERITPLGKFLRSTSLDELPELWNVIKGDMSLVGPRPLLIDYLSLYNDEQNRRHEVRPGMTGWAQVNGRNNLTWEERFKFDVWYVDNQTLLLDMKILCLTIKKVLLRDGISEKGEATMSKFVGEKKK